MKKTKAKISILIPVFNVENYLRSCLDSVCNQTVKDIEVLCVDDCSMDNSLAILKEYAEKDDRIKILRHDKNKGLLLARKTAASKATADYCLFLDSDDSLKENACEVILKQIEKTSADILMCGFELSFNGRLTKVDKMAALAYAHLPKMKLYGGKIFDRCFIDKKYAHNTIGKVVKTEICKKAFSQIVNEHIVMAEDLYTYFMFSYYAKSFVTIPEKLYRYNLGAGITGQTTLSFGTYEKTAKIALLLKDLRRFLEQNKGEKRHFNVVDKLYKQYFNASVYNWFSRLQECDKAKGFDVLVKYFDKEKIFETICLNYFSKQADVCRFASGAECLLHKKKKINTVGFFYHRMSNGGVERVIAKLVPEFLALGYKVVCFCEQQPSEDDYLLPKDVVLEVIPSSIHIGKNDYLNRSRVFAQKLAENKVDVMLYQAYNSEVFGFDALLCKINGIIMLPTFHGVFLHAANFLCSNLLDKVAFFSLCDVIHTLTKSEASFWQSFGYDARFIPNPLTFNVTNIKPAKLDNKTILWLSRLEALQKRPEDAIEIFRLVVQKVPDAKLMLVGRGDTKKIENNIKKKIKKYKLSNNVQMCGYSKNVGEFYNNASVFLMTSTFEAYPMVLGESMSYGLPCVMYELPYLELLNENNGYLSCKQKNIYACAELLVKVLQDENLKKEMGQASRQKIEEVATYDFIADWKTLFADILKGKKQNSQNECTQIVPEIVKTCLFNPHTNGDTFYAPEGAIAKVKRKIKEIGFIPTIKLCLKCLFKK